jgi:hypothetical protein
VLGEDTAAGDTWTCTLVASDGDDVTSAAEAVVVDPDLVAFWPFDGDATDACEGARDGTVTGATLTSDRHGSAASAYSFDGNDLIDMGATTFSSPVTVATWFRSTAANTVWYTIVGWNASSSTNPGIQIRAHGDGRIGVRLGDDSDDVVSTSYPDGDGDWHLVAATRDSAGTIRLYVDGVQEAVGSASASLGSGHTLYVGRSLYGQYFSGSVDDLRVYDRALSATEIARLYAL